MRDLWRDFTIDLISTNNVTGNKMSYSKSDYPSNLDKHNYT